MPCQRFFRARAAAEIQCKFSKILASESHFGTHTDGQRASHRCDSSKQLSFRPWVDGKLASFFTTV